MLMGLDVFGRYPWVADTPHNLSELEKTRLSQSGPTDESLQSEEMIQPQTQEVINQLTARLDPTVVP